LATTLTACTSWQVQTVTPEQVVTTQHPKAVRVQRTDGSGVVLENPRVSTDSLLGSTAGKQTGMPLAEVSAVATKQPAPLKSLGLILGLAAAVYLVATSVACDSCSD
jgi:hypothetical protein